MHPCRSVPILRRALPALFVLFVFFVVDSSSADPKSTPPTPEEIQKRLQIEPGLRIELVACESQIESPVSMAFDEDGKLWVVEMLDYPNGPAKGRPPEGRIKVLEDRDGDGRFEHARVFADQLLFANGLLPWKGGVIVTAAPHILYLKDTDGDGKADVREVWFEGFSTGNPQLRVSHPLLGLDGWVYVVNGLRGGKIKRVAPPRPDVSPRTSGVPEAKPLDLSGMDFRFNPLNPDQYEAISGMGQFGQTFDDWGRRFVCDNNHHLRHVVLESRYIKRNPYLAVPAVLQDTSVLDAGPLSSGAKIYPISKNWTTSSLHEGRFTAACGVFIYRGSLLPKQHYGTAFTCDPTGNLVHQEILTPHGATFKSKPAREGVEFLASPDDWFRPVFLSHGPDGAMYVVDMCRAVIEHPEFMPNELKNRPDLLWGKHHGRIWRIVPESLAKARSSQRRTLSKATTEELVKLLEHPDAWWRTTAQRLLLERQDKGAVGSLKTLLASTEQPQAKVHAAWLLKAFSELAEEAIARLLKDEHPAVRENALQLAEGALRQSKTLEEALIALQEEESERARFQLALSIGEAKPHWVHLLLRWTLEDKKLDDRWTRLAILSSLRHEDSLDIQILISFLRSEVDPKKGFSKQRLSFLREAAALLGAKQNGKQMFWVLLELLEDDKRNAYSWQVAILGGLIDGCERRGLRLEDAFQRIDHQRELLPQALRDLNALLVSISETATDAKQSAEMRRDIIRLLGHSRWLTAEPVLSRFLDDPNQELRLAAIRALSAHQRREVPELMMKDWKAHTPPVRQAVLEAMLRQPERIEYLMNEIEKGVVKPSDLDAARTRQLVTHPKPELSDRARKLLQDNLPAERKEVLAKYQEALKLKGDPKRGKVVFEKNCATCHRVAGVGVDVGPPIGDFERTRTAEQLLTDILNPNQAIDANYINYLVHTRDQRVLTGAVAVETASSITLRRAENQTDTVLRQDVDVIQSTGQSLMPDGLEKSINVQEMADLIDFLKSWRYLDGSVKTAP